MNRSENSTTFCICILIVSQVNTYFKLDNKLLSFGTCSVKRSLSFEIDDNDLDSFLCCYNLNTIMISGSVVMRYK